jgi:hypothetical protein
MSDRTENHVNINAEILPQMDFHQATLFPQFAMMEVVFDEE